MTTSKITQAVRVLDGGVLQAQCKKGGVLHWSGNPIAQVPSLDIAMNAAFAELAEHRIETGHTHKGTTR